MYIIAKNLLLIYSAFTFSHAAHAATKDYLIPIRKAKLQVRQYKSECLLWISVFQ